MDSFRSLLTAALIAFSVPSLAGSVDQVAAIVSNAEPPAGVVFEIVANKNGLRWAIPQVQGYVVQLRQRFPAIDIAVVSHGNELFALQRAKQGEFGEVHAQVKSLATMQNVPVHVCETYAGWKGVSAEAFPDYVDVTPTGPAQINNYVSLGYIRVVVEPDKP